MAIKDNLTPFRTHELFAYIYRKRGIDFSLYRHATISRKLDLRLQETGMKDYNEYLAFLKAHPGEMDQLIRALTIKVSNFFRNPLVFEMLDAVVFPHLLIEWKHLRVWSIGCAYGQEPYSIAMIVKDLQKREQKPFDCRIWASDLDAAAIARAAIGEYPEAELHEVKKKYLDAFFTELIPEKKSIISQERIYRISPRIKKMVTFIQEDLVSRVNTAQKDQESYHIVLCRNVLIYLNRELQEELLVKITDLLPVKGCLILGETETLPESVREKFTPFFPEVKIFIKKSDLKR